MNTLPILLLATQTASIAVNPTQVLTRWEGWGTSLCWMGNAFGGREDVCDLLFSRKEVAIEGKLCPGLGLNIVRYNAGACGPGEVDGRKMTLSSKVLPFRQIEGLWLDPTKGEEGWDWSRDRLQRDMMLAAKKRGANRFELFSNSPMWWMCANANPSGATDPNSDNLSPSMVKAFANYLATIAAESPRRWGVRFTSVEPFNEPASDYWGAGGRQEGCHFSPASQAKFLPILRAALDSKGLRRLAISASDETSYSHAVSTWKALAGPTKALIDQVNIHGYEENGAKRLELAGLLGSKKRWNSERGDGDADGISTARELAFDINHLKVSAWCYWQPLDGGGWGLLDCDMPTARVNKVNPKLYVVAQYSRHIRPGMDVLQSSDPMTVIARDRRRGKVVIVIANPGEASTRSFDLAALKAERTKVTSWRTQPREGLGYEKQDAYEVIGPTLQVSLPAHSVQTYELTGIQDE